MPNLKKLEEIALALEPNHRTFRQFHVCGIYLRGRMISLAANCDKTHPATKQFAYHDGPCKLHAELRAVLKLGDREDFHKMELAVLRIDMNRKFNNSCPCTGCTDLIKTLNFKRVFYTDANGMWVQSNDIESIPHRGYKTFTAIENRN